MADQQIPEKLVFHFIKSNFFRVIHADGVHGGVTPRGLIHMAFFSERSPLPQRTSLPFNKADGTASGMEVTEVSREGVVREVEADVLMTLETAEAFHNWLSAKIDTLKRMNDTK